MPPPPQHTQTLPPIPCLHPSLALSLALPLSLSCRSLLSRFHIYTLFNENMVWSLSQCTYMQYEHQYE